MKISCCTGALVLNLALAKIREDKGSSFARDCSYLLSDVDSYLLDSKNPNRCYTSDLDAFLPALQQTVGKLRIVKMGKLDPEPYVKAISDYATKIYSGKWLKKWKADNIRYFRKFSHIMEYAHEELIDTLSLHRKKLPDKREKPKLPEPKVVISAPMPFGWDTATYYEDTDSFVFFTTGVKTRFKLYYQKFQGKTCYEGYDWPRPHAEMVYLIAHETAHRCMHLMFPKKIYAWLNDKFLEEYLAKILGLKVLNYYDNVRTKAVYEIFKEEI